MAVWRKYAIEFCDCGAVEKIAAIHSNKSAESKTD